MPYSVTQDEPPIVLKLLAHKIRWQLLSLLTQSDYRVQELGQLLQKPLNLISYHLRLLREESLVQEHRSSADARDVYYSLDFEHVQKLYESALAGLSPIPLAITVETSVETSVANSSANSVAPLPYFPVRILFVCTRNDANSQLAEAFFRHLAGDRVEVFSAGIEPSALQPEVLEILQEEGIDTTGLHTKSIEQFIGQRFDYVITVCDRAREACPVFPGKPTQVHWSLPEAISTPLGESKRLAMMRVFVVLENRLKILQALIDRNQSSK